MNPYRIAFVVPSFPNISETFIYHQIIELMHRGHDIRIFAYKENKNTIIHKMILDNKLQEICTFLPRSFMQKSKSAALKHIKKILRISAIIEESAVEELEWKRTVQFFNSVNIEKWFSDNTTFDIIHVQFGVVGIPIVRMINTNSVHNAKLVVTFHGNDLNPFRIAILKEWYSDLFEYADALTVNSPYLREILLSICDQKQKIHLLPVGLNIQNFKPDSSQKKRTESGVFQIIFCGRLIFLKGADLAIKIIYDLVSRLNIQNVKLNIIGTGPMKEALEKLIINLNLQEFVVLKGAESQEELKVEMSDAHLFILPGIHDPSTNRAETQGLVIQEAQAMGLPVLVSDAGGMKYGLIDGVTGYIIKAGDIESFSEKIIFFMQNESLRQIMGIAGREFVTNNYDIRSITDRLEVIYSEIINQNLN